MTILTKEQLLAATTKKIELSIGAVEIRKLKLGEMNSGDVDQEEFAFKLLSLSLVNPSMTPDEVRELPADVALELQEKVMEFNGLGDDAASAIEKN